MLDVQVDLPSTRMFRRPCYGARQLAADLLDRQRDAMKQVYWLDPIDKLTLISTLMRELAGEAEIALEGEANELAAFDFVPFPEFAKDHVAIQRRMSNENGKMLIMHLSRGPSTQSSRNYAK